ncbi:hypothetical protein LAZ67_3006054 [Cordylochernes scorpioides]|uniref:Reverse transcriptase domain-containing protein n=1 Tax=Cordylochernes scorpioides TaxID=51811 RepID=A0ABY6KB89_9ARAC|nr:hypothetical protein LAZ67_3006054 [Cordylochernes scorpioides]
MWCVSIFRKPYFMGHFLPALLTPTPVQPFLTQLSVYPLDCLSAVPDVKMKFIQELHKAKRIPTKMYDTFQQECSKATSRLVEEMRCEDLGQEVLEPEEEVQSLRVKLLSALAGESAEEVQHLAVQIASALVQLPLQQAALLFWELWASLPSWDTTLVESLSPGLVKALCSHLRTVLHTPSTDCYQAPATLLLLRISQLEATPLCSWLFGHLPFSDHFMRVPLQGYGGAVSVLMLESAAKASASMLGTASNYRQSQTFTKVCLDHGTMINESCTPIPHSMRSDVDLHAASPVAQNKQGRVQDLGRGFCPISIIQSPQTSHFATSKQLSILQCNINGLCSTATKIKLEEIMEIAEKQKIQIIALQETKLNEKYNLKYKNYNILRKDRNKEGGGLAFLIKNLYYEDIAINIPNTSDLEAQGIKVYLNQNKTINIFNMYHPPNNKLIDDGTMAQFLTDNTIILGDLNAKHQLWGCSTPNPRGKILSNLFDDNAFMCLNDGNPTHHSYSYNTAQALDISFSSPDIFHKCKWQILKSIGSDHLPILIEISTKTKTSSIKEKFWNFKKANWNLYQQNTNEDFRKAPTRIKDLEQNWISFKNTIIKAAKVSIPRGNIKKWIPNYTHQAKDIQTLITKRNELQKKCTQNQTNCRTELNIVNAKIKRLYVNMKREKWKQTCENLNPRNPNTKLWHLAKQIDRAQPQTENTNLIKNTDGTPATNDKNAANILGNSYQISSKIKFEIKDKKVEKKARKIIHDCKNVTSTHNIFHEKINMKELDYALENTDLNKTPGPDGIHGQMISNLGKNGKDKLLDIFNNSWKTGKLPQDWKTATIIPIKKLDKSADDPKNYRPISLTSICCKLMEKIILRRLTYHLDTRNLLPKEQYGFRKGHGTIDQLLFFTQKVKDAQNRKPTNHTIAAFLDLTQAFDKVWKNKLITKLYKHFQIDGKAITWINDFLKNRYIRVKYNGTLSKTFKLYQGLPQGSVLSPTLFTLFIAGIEEKISHKTNIGLFADDIILWSSNTNWKKAERDLNKSLSHLEKFANKHKLEFNPQKSETCLFTTDKKLYKIRPKIILKEQQLQYNKHPKYLGYTLDPEINSSKHIQEVIRKGRDRLKILKYISGREWGADATTLKLTYTSLIRPILEYGYQIYGTASETNLKSLERIQLSAARIITGLRNTCPNDIVLYEADIMPLKDRRSYNLPKYINKIKSYGNKHRTSKYILNWESNLRLKKEGPLHLAKRNEFLKYKVEKNYLAEKISPCKPLQNVIFNATLNEPTNKQYQNPEYLKQLSLEIINNIPKNAITIYTDGSRDELGHTGSGCLIKTTNGIEKMNRRNPDFCSVFRSELIAIYEALKSIRNTNYQDIWILTDSRSAIQHLSHTGELRDKVSRNIIGNEAADVLAKKGTKEPLPQKNRLTFKEIETIAKTKINKNWRIPPKHSWYSGVNPGGALNIRNRQHQTTLTRFRTGHLKPLKIENNNKIYPTCPKCSLVPAAPEHILACIRCTKQDLWERPLLIIKQLAEHELMEFVVSESYLRWVGQLAPDLPASLLPPSLLDKFQFGCLRASKLPDLPSSLLQAIRHRHQLSFQRWLELESDMPIDQPWDPSEKLAYVRRVATRWNKSAVVQLTLSFLLESHGPVHPSLISLLHQGCWEKLPQDLLQEHLRTIFTHTSGSLLKSRMHRFFSAPHVYTCEKQFNLHLQMCQCPVWLPSVWLGDVHCLTFDRLTIAPLKYQFQGTTPTQ